MDLQASLIQSIFHHLLICHEVRIHPFERVLYVRQGVVLALHAGQKYRTFACLRPIEGARLQVVAHVRVLLEAPMFDRCKCSAKHPSL